MDDTQVVMYMALFKRFGLFWLLKSKCITTMIAWLILLFIYTVIGLWYSILDDIDGNRLCQVAFVYVNYLLGGFKFATIFLKTDEIFKIYNFARSDFLTSRQCRSIGEHNITTLKYRNKIVCFIYALLGGVTFIVWVFSPLVYKLMSTNVLNHLLHGNVLNLYYPIAKQSYEKYYYLIYANESLIVAWTVWIYVLFDVLYLSLCWAIATHYETITSALTTLGDNSDGQKDIDQDLKTIIFDIEKAYKFLKEFHSIFNVIALVHVVVFCCSFIVNSYFISLHIITRSFNYNLFEFTSSFVFLFSQFVMYSYFLDLLNEKKDGLNLGLYSCDWTATNIHFKKLLLLTMKMNSANQLKIKLTPNKVINLMLFIKALHMSYSIVSVMLNVKLSNLN